MVDVDELIVPRHPDDKTWTDMIKRAPCPADVTYYGGRHLLYRLPPNSSESNDTGLTILDRLHRNELIYVYPIRGKYMGDPGKIVGDMVTHSVSGPIIHSDKMCIMPVTVGGNHHYRRTPLKMKSNTWILDNITLKYSDLLKRRIAEVEQNLRY